MRIALAALVGLIGLSVVGATVARADDEAVDTSRGADKGALGIGLVLGEPTGVTAKLYLQDDQAIQAAIGSALIGGGLQIHADYVFHPLILQARPAFVMPLYVGPGVRVIDYTAGRGDTGFLAVGLRAVVGIVIDFKTVPLDAFIEAAGVFEYQFKDGKGFEPALNAGAGVRYYF